MHAWFITIVTMGIIYVWFWYFHEISKSLSFADAVRDGFWGVPWTTKSDSPTFTTPLLSLSFVRACCLARCSLAVWAWSVRHVLCPYWIGYVDLNCTFWRLILCVEADWIRTDTPPCFTVPQHPRKSWGSFHWEVCRWRGTTGIPGLSGMLLYEVSLCVKYFQSLTSRSAGIWERLVSLVEPVWTQGKCVKAVFRSWILSVRLFSSSWMKTEFQGAIKRKLVSKYNIFFKTMSSRLVFFTHASAQRGADDEREEAAKFSFICIVD